MLIGKHLSLVHIIYNPFWHAPIVYSETSRHQSLSHTDRFIQGEVIGFQVMPNRLQPHSYEFTSGDAK